ncbi:hypothetical protein IW261DRAFT_1573469 [Armillaria novae-zelandiae]|uniref:Uncharacterized protein n=1 Tax=Armillaria novae-zelandiae TaxID=153914 RepID=A0AA39NNM9_9AGAR|nr:hypothetical protein IW261DRAFT_1573469 [Armillaria novae-zelandiae]
MSAQTADILRYLMSMNAAHYAVSLTAVAPAFVPVGQINYGVAGACLENMMMLWLRFYFNAYKLSPHMDVHDHTSFRSLAKGYS